MSKWEFVRIALLALAISAAFNGILFSIMVALR
jgi:hypothetical protein